MISTASSTESVVVASLSSSRFVVPAGTMVTTMESHSSLELSEPIAPAQLRVSILCLNPC